MSMESDLQLPPISSVPSDQHAQLLYALGAINQNLKSINEYQKYQNGRLDKHDVVIAAMQARLDKAEGEEDGVSKTWVAMFTLAGLIIGALTVYVTIRH